MLKNTLKTTTALVASLALIVPVPAVGQADPGGDFPLCAADMDTSGTTPEERGCLTEQEMEEAAAAGAAAETAEPLTEEAAEAAEAAAEDAAEATESETEPDTVEEAATTKTGEAPADDAAAVEAESAATEEAATGAEAETAAEGEAAATDDAAAADAETEAAADAEAETGASETLDEATEAVKEDNAAAQATTDAPAAETTEGDAAAGADTAEAGAEDGPTDAAAETAANQEPAASEDAQATEQASEEATEEVIVEDEAPAAAAAAEAEAEPEEVTEEVATEETTRSSDEDFETSVSDAMAAQSAPAADDDDGLNNLEKAALAGLGILAVGALLNNGSEVVANTGDRVVVRQGDELRILKDDDALLRRPGVQVHTATYDDGSTRTRMIREDGSEIITIRDAQGRVLRRTRIEPDGTEILLFDDLWQAEPVNRADLRKVVQDVETYDMSTANEEALRAALEADRRAEFARRFSLRQVRHIREVRELMPRVDLDAINFETGSAAIDPEEARALSSLGTILEDYIRENPREVFLIEGHTDAVGDATYNLALSDRRAESVALALTEYFDIPPENLVVQGYGEEFLKEQTDGPSAMNRRATVRRITPLLKTAAAGD